MTNRIYPRCYLSVVFVLVAMACAVSLATAQNEPPLTLRDAIGIALEANLGIKQAVEDVRAAEATRKQRITEFLPTLSSTYSYLYRDQETVQSIGGATGTGDFVINPQDEYNFVTSFNQPVFTGFAILNQYKVANLGLDIAQIQETLARQDIIVQANNVYFQVLKAQKLLGVADERVKQVKAQENVARNFYEVGMTPLNELLQAQVELANAKQAFINAYNNLETAKSNFRRSGLLGYLLRALQLFQCRIDCTTVPERRL